MRFNYKQSSKFPQLAWCAIISKGKEAIDVKCGNAVQVNDNFFVAGVWDGEFQDGDFANSSFVSCTGATVNKCKWGG